MLEARRAVARSVIAAFTIVAGVVLLTGCGETVIDDGKAEDAIQSSLEESLERKITAVACPSDQKVEPEATFTCSVTFGNGDKATATIEILNKDADVEIVGLKANE